MRRFIVILAALFAGVVAADAQTVSGVTVADYTMQRAGEYVVVDMDIDISDLKVKGSDAVVLTPYITSGTNSVALQSVGIYSRNRDFYYQRNDDIKPHGEDGMAYRSGKAPEVVAYHTVVPYEAWMNGSQLVFQRTDCGCGNAVVASESSVLVDGFGVEPFKPTPIYICPDVEFVPREISGRAYVDFPVSNTDIDPNYRGNISEIARIVATIDAMKQDEDVAITSITITGHASPESPYSNNERLAKGRAEALKRYVESLHLFDEDIITADFVAEDWAGLESYVETSTLANRDAILEIIRSTDDPDHKEWLIKSRYPADYRHLLDNCYPALRHSDYTIRYAQRRSNNVADIEDVMNTAPQQLTLEEFYLLAQHYESGSDEFVELWEVAVRMYPQDETANFNAANVAMARGDYDKASRYLDKAGDSPEVTYSRGCIALGEGDYDKALALFREADERGVAEARAAVEAIESNWTVRVK
ncbi:MAG: DUF3868 domain-containing protein [Alistipes sp.]|nr:DUF3868 domain-containing protein [Alistipes sp.]